MVVLPLVLFTTAVVLDMVYMAGGRGGFATAAGYVIGAGLVAGLVVAVTGLAAWTTIPHRTPAKRVGMWHSGGNVLVLSLFAASWFIRLFHSWVPSPAALTCGLAGLALAGVTGWLGADAIERLRARPAFTAAAVSTVPRQQLRKMRRKGKP